MPGISLRSRILSLLGIFLAVFGTLLRADTVLVVPVSPYGFYGYPNPGFLNPFDKDFFKSNPNPQADQSRTYGDAISYSPEQREQWTEKCTPERSKGMARFRECFAKERKKAKLALQESYDAVNERSNQPFTDLSN